MLFRSVFDFDGVFTDNKVIVVEDGREAVICNRSDGLAVEQFKKLDIPMLIISGEKNQVAQTRCKKLGITCINGVQDKVVVLTDWLKKNNIDIGQVVYVGNDINDISCLESVGCGVVVSDAYPQAKAVAEIILSASGGCGAVREIIELITQRLEGEKNARKD